MSAASTTPTAISAAAPIISIRRPLRCPGPNSPGVLMLVSWSDRMARAGARRDAGSAASADQAAAKCLFRLVRVGRVARCCLPSTQISGIQKSDVCWFFFGPAGPSFADWIVVPTSHMRNRPAPAGSGVSVAPSAPRVRVERVEREFWFVALTQKQPECTLPLPAPLRRGREALLQHRERPVELGALAACRGLRVKDLLDQCTIDSTGEQRSPDPIGTPLLELALVLDK